MDVTIEHTPLRINVELVPIKNAPVLFNANTLSWYQEGVEIDDNN